MDLADPRPLRDHVAALIVRRIREGVYPVGSQTHTTQELARECDVSTRTVAEAVKLLRERGILRGLGGRGVYVIAVPEEDEDAADEETRNGRRSPGDGERRP